VFSKHANNFFSFSDYLYTTIGYIYLVMERILKNREIMFGLKIGLLFSLILLASSMKTNNNNNKIKKIVNNTSIKPLNTVSVNF